MAVSQRSELRCWKCGRMLGEWVGHDLLIRHDQRVIVARPPARLLLVCPRCRARVSVRVCRPRPRFPGQSLLFGEQGLTN